MQALKSENIKSINERYKIFRNTNIPSVFDPLDRIPSVLGSNDNSSLIPSVIGSNDNSSLIP